MPCDNQPIGVASGPKCAAAIVLEEDEHFYKWADHYLEKVYAAAGGSKFFLDVLDQGIGKLITSIHFEKDIT